MKIWLLVALVGAVKASEVAVDAPEKFLKNKKLAKISQLGADGESVETILNRNAADFSLSAEPEADADAYYGYYGYARPYAYGYGRAYGYGYPYTAYRYYGKRSADAEQRAEAEADADAYYGYYGYARPYAYGAYGYGHAYDYGYPRAYGYYGKRSASLVNTFPFDAADGEHQGASNSGTRFGNSDGNAGNAGNAGNTWTQGKRSADADPAVLAGASRIVSAPSPLIHNLPVRPVIAAPVLGYAGYPSAYGKRSAQEDTGDYCPGCRDGIIPAAGYPYAGSPALAAPVLGYGGYPYAESPALAAPVLAGASDQYGHRLHQYAYGG